MFSNTSSAGTAQDLAITKLTLNVIPANSTSYAPPEVDLSQTTSGSYTVNDLTDYETYLFQIRAYNASNTLIWAGETPAAIVPAGISVTVNSIQITSSSATYLADAKSLLASKDVTNSKNKLMLATLSNQQNSEAKLFYALTRIIGLYDNLGSTNNSQLDSVKKILEASGITYLNLNSLSSSNHPKVGLPKQLPSTTPTTGQVVDYVRYNILPEIDAALITLSGFPINFSATFSPKAYNLDGSDIIIDYADVQVIKTYLKYAKTSVALACAYNFDVNLVNNINKNVTDLTNYNNATQGDLFNMTKVLQSNTSIGTIREMAMMTAAKTAYDAFVSNYETALNLIKARTMTSQHMFVLDYPTQPGSSGARASKLDEGLNSIKQIQSALNGQTVLAPKVVQAAGSKVYNFYTGPAGFRQYSAARPSKNNTVNFSQFFNVSQPINLRTAFVDCATRSMFKDNTFAGIYPLGYATSPVYNKGPGSFSYNGGYGGWDIDSIYNMSGPDKQTVIDGICFGSVTASW